MSIEYIRRWVCDACLLAVEENGDGYAAKPPDGWLEDDTRHFCSPACVDGYREAATSAAEHGEHARVDALNLLLKRHVNERGGFKSHDCHECGRRSSGTEGP